MDFTPFGYPTIKSSHFDGVFVRWGETIAAVGNKTKPNNEDESQVADAVLARLFRDIRAHLDGANGNGIGLHFEKNCLSLPKHNFLLNCLLLKKQRLLLRPSFFSRLKSSKMPHRWKQRN